MDTLTTRASDVITSDRVTGTDVFNPAGDSLGTIDHLVIDKRSGQVVYAVLEFGGLFGLGTDRYPLPWGTLKYDLEKDGYVVPLEKEQLSDAPRYSSEALEGRPPFDEAYGRSVYEYYKTPWLFI